MAFSQQVAIIYAPTWFVPPYQETPLVVGLVFQKQTQSKVNTHEKYTHPCSDNLTPFILYRGLMQIYTYIYTSEN